jgi:hypothetical protein
LLKHLATIISLWVDILAGCLHHQDCVYSITNITTTEGWLKKSNFTELSKSPIQVSVQTKSAQMQATLFMSLGLKSYSQWFKGVQNKVLDALSCNNDRSNKEQAQIIKSFCPS